MKLFKRVLAFFIILCILTGMVPDILGQVFAAPVPVEVMISNYADGTLTINWGLIPGAKKVTLSSSTPGITFSNIGLSSATAGGLSNNVVYDIKVDIFSDDAGTVKIGEGLVYYIPRIIFKAEIMDQNYVDIPSGGREIGTQPKIKLKWDMPVVWDGDSYEYICDELQTMQSKLKSIYSNTKDLAAMNFSINISTDVNYLNGDSDISSVIVSFDGSGYKARVSGNDNVTSDVAFDRQTGEMSFILAGVAEKGVELPQTDGINLPHGEILPGTVYYMNIKPIFLSTDGSTAGIVRVGNPADQNGSMLYGTVPYTYTPIRFKLSKDAAGNLYVKIYKLNQGSLNLPRLYYEVQLTDDPSISGDWSVKKTMDDSYFASGAGYAITVISGIGVNNNLYYKIVVKSDAVSDRIESCSMPYNISKDLSRPPVPQDVGISGLSLVTREIEDADGTKITQKSTDVTISWLKPDDWDSIKNENNPDNEIYYHILLNTYQSDMDIQPPPELTAEGVKYGQFPAIYRLVRYVSAKSPNIVEKGDRLEYTLKGFELFKGEDADGICDEQLPNAENYPDMILPNKVYYVQMYTTKGTANKGSMDPDDMSDRSVPVSFTSLSSVQLDVPLPKNFRLTKNAIEKVEVPEPAEINYLEFQFDKVSIDWNYYIEDKNQQGQAKEGKIYYDIFMSTQTGINSFILIGTTEDVNGDVQFTGLDDDSTSIKFMVKNFTSQELVNRFGEHIRPNATYYFMIRTRLVIDGMDEDLTSVYTPMLAVTTVRGEIVPPGDEYIFPLAPADFSIALDEEGVPLVSGSAVTFEWTKQENDVYYVIICTSKYVPYTAKQSEYMDDNTYKSFILEFGGEIVIDPSSNPLQHNLEYDSTTKKLRYKIDRWLYPNKLYYFSIKAVKKGSGNSSWWISIPVTTAAVEAPIFIEPVNDSEIGFSWIDNTGVANEGYNVYLRGPEDVDYKLLSKSQAVVSSEGNVYYCRIYGLKPSTMYSVRVCRGYRPEVVVFERYDLVTSDIYKEVEVRWKAKRGYTYEIAVAMEGSTEYYTLTGIDTQQFVDVYGNVYPYYIEESADTSGNDYAMFYARIKTIPVTTAYGSIEHRALKSNTKYYVKVRAVKIDPLNPALTAYSKYTAPAEVRTEFSQKDYDDEEQAEDRKNKLLDRIEELEKNLYWRVGLNDPNANMVLLKGKRTANLINTKPSNDFEIDLPEIRPGMDTNIIYIPSEVFKELLRANRSFIIKTTGAEFVLRPGTIYFDNTGRIQSLEEAANSKDAYVKISIEKQSGTTRGMPQGSKSAAPVNTLDVEIMFSTITDDKLQEDIHKLLYDDRTGIVQQKAEQIKNSDIIGIGYDGDLEALIESYVEEIESYLSDYIYMFLEQGGSMSGTISSVHSISSFSVPFEIKLKYDRLTGNEVPYALYYGTSAWQKVGGDVITNLDYISFDAYKKGRYTIISLASPYSNKDIPAEVVRLIQKYGIDDILKDENAISLYNVLSVKDAVLIFDRLVNNGVSSPSASTLALASRLGLDGLIDVKNPDLEIKKQDVVVMAVELYCRVSGIDISRLTPKASIFYLNDLELINKNVLKHIYIALDLGLIEMPADGYFQPGSSLSSQEVLQIFAKALFLG